MLRCERDLTVTDYCSQPTTIRWVDTEGRNHSYIPDIMVWRADGSVEIYEVTLSSRYELKPNLLEREKIGKQMCEAKGWVYRVFDERTLPDDTEVANLLAVYCFRARAYRKREVVEAIIDHLHFGELVFVNQLREEMVAKKGLIRAETHSTIFHMLWHGELETDWQSLLFDGTTPLKSARVWLARP